MKFIGLILFFFSFNLSAQDSAATTQQKAACAANSARVWSPEVNRCVDQAQAVAIRNKAKECNAIADMAARSSCHQQLAASDTGLSNASFEASMGKMSDLQSRSALINTANTIVSVINMIAGPAKTSSCMCKKIFGITAFAGTVSDIFLKIKTKKTLESLANKYQIDSKTTAYDAQYKALQYLRDEQLAVADIASLEKKRQMLLMIGYGAAALTAAYETFGNAACNKPEEEKPKKEVCTTPGGGEGCPQAPVAEAAAPAETTCTPGAEGCPTAAVVQEIGAPITKTEVTSTSLEPSVVPATPVVTTPDLPVTPTDQGNLNAYKRGVVQTQVFTAPDGTRYVVDSSRGGSGNLYPETKLGSGVRDIKAPVLGSITVPKTGPITWAVGNQSGSTNSVTVNGPLPLFSNVKTKVKGP